ncbi:MAG: PQQ-binding-like beta-propeller repeat protein [Planctomycetota bacterium]|nr:PQQ-binding-like beta-propeller repeat protein [Planctomycetota bacterium]
MVPNSIRIASFCLTIGLAANRQFLPPLAAFGGDWPQTLGPQRSGTAEDEAEINQIPIAGPLKVWQCAVGDGFAGVAVANDRLFLYHRIEQEEIIESRSTQTGDIVWRQVFPTDYSCSYNPDGGPRCVPLVHAERIILHGAGGHLRCLATDTGNLLWEHDTLREYSVTEGYFGAGSSPVIHQGLVILNVGGRKGAGIVAFQLSDGDLKWSIPNEQASYSSPRVASVQGTPQLLCVTRLNFIAADPATGHVIGRLPFGARGPTVNAAAPVVIGEHAFLSASYGVGARWVALGGDSTRETWSREDIMSSQYSTCIEHQGVLYGIDGREDIGSATLRAVDPKSPKVLWESKDFGMANLIRVNDVILLIKTNGELVMIQADRERFHELGRAMLSEGVMRALPAYAHGHLYVRDATQLYCFRMTP